MPPLGASASAEGDGDKKKAAGLGIFWAAYISLLESQPILTKSLTSMTGFALGDLLAQKFIEKRVGSVAARLPDLSSRTPIYIFCCKGCSCLMLTAVMYGGSPLCPTRVDVSVKYIVGSGCRSAGSCLHNCGHIRVWIRCSSVCLLRAHDVHTVSTAYRD